MRIFFRVLLVIVLIAAVTGAIYYFVGQSKLEKKKVSEYLDENAVVYYDLKHAGSR
jgi:flagellar basal body-associated protein FliL